MRVKIVTKEPVAAKAKVSKNVASVRGMSLSQNRINAGYKKVDAE